MTPNALMVTSHLEYWLDEYPDRPYAALIDMSQVDSQDYYQVNRGFGNEFYVTNPQKAKVIKVMPVQQALNINQYYLSCGEKAPEFIRGDESPPC